ncbi:hypothetical protein [Acidianus brierleyi]|uniref:Uncharacterized protein n=1 Tax=Acidianus brierleyi TaxID=41673 RepID=A0A2U9IH63_9CREN|nr:hypothetical protein [Acidianus brierleyi]AWR95387.1 hypothetical protein DFR85_13050 [Acidianus brierleyi]
MPNAPVDIIVMKPEECNENNVNLSHMLYYGYKILSDNLELKDKIYNMIIKNKDKLKDILPYDIKSGHKKNSFLKLRIRIFRNY